MSISVKTSAYEVDVLVPYTITAEIKGPNVPSDQVFRIEMKRGSGGYIKVGEGRGNPATIRRVSFNPGMWQVRAVAELNGTTYISHSINVHEMFPDSSCFASHPIVRGYLNELWKMSVAFAQENRNTHKVREYGQLVYLSMHGGVYLGEVVEGPEIALDHNGAYASVFFNEDIEDTDINNPNRCEPIVIGSIHVHYPITWATEGQRSTGPSANDERTAFPGLLIDYSEPIIYAGHRVNKRTETYWYGPTRRETWF